MHAIAIDHFGGPEQLTLHELPVPTPGPNGVLIKVQVAGVGGWDATERSGAMVQVTPDAVKKFPRILGADGAGTVAAIGADVTGFRIGDEVYAAGYLNPKGGFYAQYAAVEADQVALVPSGLKLEEAGVLALTGVTALRGLSDHLKLKASQHLLIFGASGGVGQPAVQLAKAMGAHVLAVVSNAEGATVAKESGADVVINSKTEDLKAAITAFAPAGLDAVLVLVNGDGLPDSIAAVRAGGRVAYPHGVRPAPTGRPDIDVIGYDGNPHREVLDRLSALVASRPFSVHISDRFALADAPQAHRALADHHAGRVVLNVT
jgi:NADPH:quinone reductase-like Zn-dependent oxidoreductase